MNVISRQVLLSKDPNQAWRLPALWSKAEHFGEAAASRHWARTSSLIVNAHDAVFLYSAHRLDGYHSFAHNLYTRLTVISSTNDRRVRDLSAMRFLKIDSHGELILTTDEASPPAAYAILSHTWGADDDEVTLDDIEKKAGRNKTGYTKLWFCANQAK